MHGNIMLGMDFRLFDGSIGLADGPVRFGDGPIMLEGPPGGRGGG